MDLGCIISLSVHESISLWQRQLAGKLIKTSKLQVKTGTREKNSKPRGASNLSITLLH